MSERFEMEFGTRTKRAGLAGPASPMRVLLMGDFGGREAGRPAPEVADLAARKTVEVDAESFERVMRRVAPRAELNLGSDAGKAEVEFSSLDDFHPDHLFRVLPVFRRLREMRDRLQNPSTFAAAAAELRGAPGEPAAASPPAPAEPESENDTAMFERLLGQAPGDSAQRKPPTESEADLSRFLRNAVGPHLAPDVDPQAPQIVASLDRAIAELMRGVLQDPALRRLEVAWRGLHWLIQRLETGEQLRLFLLDVTRDELLADLRLAGGEPNSTGLHRLLVEQGVGSPGGEPWSLLVGQYYFGPSAEDVGLLITLGALATQAGGPFLAGADPSVLGCPSFAGPTDPTRWTLDEDSAKRWGVLRGSPVAPAIGLALPRFLLRMPYGAETEAVESFEFEEMARERDHDAYLWGNPAVACAMLLGRTFLDAGWSRGTGDLVEIDDLPSHTYRDSGEWKMQPCAEAWLSDAAADAILERGIMPLLSRRDRNSAQLVRFQSVAAPACELWGPWS